jgi:aspartyl-tRNA(Asn)/glutamyl-tRNA(Gln) amidotransferase subunit C
MPAIDSGEVVRLARLARLELSAGEIARLVPQLARVLEHVRKLEQVDTCAVEPMPHALPLPQPLRADVPAPGLPVDAALGIAGEQHDGFLVVPGILADSGE